MKTAKLDFMPTSFKWLDVGRFFENKRIILGLKILRKSREKIANLLRVDSMDSSSLLSLKTTPSQVTLGLFFVWNHFTKNTSYFLLSFEQKWTHMLNWVSHSKKLISLSRLKVWICILPLPLSNVKTSKKDMETRKITETYLPHQENWGRHSVSENKILGFFPTSTGSFFDKLRGFDNFVTFFYKWGSEVFSSPSKNNRNLGRLRHCFASWSRIFQKKEVWKKLKSSYACVFGVSDAIVAKSWITGV